jgi:hypothetical protein
MFIITYDEQRGIYYYRNITESFKDRNEANSRWVELKKNPLIANMRPSTTEEPEQPYIAVQVLFSNYSKKYTYLANDPVEVGQLVVVRTEEGLKVVTCVGCTRATRSQLEVICPFNKFKKIVGKVV